MTDPTRASNRDELPPSVPKPGDLFAERYRIERVLGVGGMGFVLAATHLQLRERVAIKLLLPQLAHDPQVVERFLREGRAAVKIQSQHVARVLDVGALPDKTPYLVLEYLDGRDLSQVIQERSRVPYAQAVDWILEASEAIAEAHAMNVVHRDLKPANMFLSRMKNGEEIVKVLDFGISKMTGIEQGNMAMTKTSAMLGSPLYMSPEQLKSSRNVDQRADLWALGVIVYELITGSPPFMAETLAELGAAVLGGVTPRLLDAAPTAPRGLSDVIATCLQKQPADRFANLSDFAMAIAPYGGAAAEASCRRIVQTLGVPVTRATIVSSPSSPALPAQARTQALDRADLRSSGSSPSGLVSTGKASSPVAPSAPFSYGVTATSGDVQRSRSRVLAILGVLVAMGLVGAGLVYVAKTPPRPTVAVEPHSAATTPPPPSAEEPQPTASATPATSATAPSTVASATTSAPPPVAARTGRGNVKPSPRPSAAPNASPAAPEPAPPKPTSPSGIATSTKD